jgi:class 3 adenylate cyclase
LTAKEHLVSAIDASLAAIEFSDVVAFNSAKLINCGLTVRIGIHTGDLVVKKVGKSKKTTEVLGEGYFTANCLKNLADDFEIAASSLLRQGLSLYFDFEDWDMNKWCTLKGIKEGLFIINDKTKPNECFYEKLASGF